jgi:uncharacterized membrane protein
MFTQYFMLTMTISLFCLGLRAITDTGMIGYPIRLFFQKHAPYWGKPVILCSTCMSSFWGTVISLLLVFQIEITTVAIMIWIGSTISAAFVNALLWEYYQSVNSCR